MERFNTYPYLVVRKNLLNEDLFRVEARFETMSEAENFAINFAASNRDKVYFVMEVRSALRCEQAEPAVPVTLADYGTGAQHTYWV